MANILVLGVKVPFTSGGQELLVRELCRALQRRGYTADIVELPYHVNSREALLEQALQWENLDLSRFAGLRVDRIIATKFPSYFARPHQLTSSGTTSQKKSLWLVHQHRPIYDLYASQFSDFSDDPRSEAIRRRLVKMDQRAIGECEVITGISNNVVDRLSEYLSVTGSPLYPPLPCGDAYYCDSAEPYILSVGRICRIKRLDFLIKALPQIRPHVRLVVAGQPDDPEFFDYIKNEISKHHLEHRVSFVGRVEEQELLRLFARSMGVYYAPYDEDYGFVSLEAMASSKPVISATDSGGVLEFVRDSETGIVAEPTVSSIAAAVNRLADDEPLRLKLGLAGRQHIEATGLLQGGWDRVIDTLLANPSTAALENTRGGGQLCA